MTIYPDIPSEISRGNRARFREAHGVDPDALCVGVVGNITRGRAQDLLLRALPAIRREIPQVCCLIAGTTLPRSPDLAYHRELETLIEDLGLEDAVRWCGHVDDMADFYAAADVVVNPARHLESFGRVALEALAAGRPVVSTSVGAVPEILRNGRDALLIDPDRRDELADAVIRLATDRELAVNIVREGGRRARAEFGRTQAVQPFAELVMAISRRPVPSPRA